MTHTHIHISGFHTGFLVVVVGGEGEKFVGQRNA